MAHFSKKAFLSLAAFVGIIGQAQAGFALTSDLDADNYLVGVTAKLTIHAKGTCNKLEVFWGDVQGVSEPIGKVDFGANGENSKVLTHVYTKPGIYKPFVSDADSNASDPKASRCGGSNPYPHREAHVAALPTINVTTVPKPTQVPSPVTAPGVLTK